MSTALESQAASEAGVLGLLRRQATRPEPLPNDVELTNQVAVITGSNAGLGFEASRQLLRLGLSHLVMGVRSQARGDKAALHLRQEFPTATVSVWLLDMESTDSVRDFAARCATLPRLDIVILNAGGMTPSYATVADSENEITIQANYLSTVLLSILLLPALRSPVNQAQRKTARPPVLSVVGSDLMYLTDFDMAAGPVLPRLNDPAGFSQPRWYGTSKLLLMMAIWKLAQRVEPHEVLIHVVNPGMTAGTAFFDNHSLLDRMKVWCVWRIVGARLLDTAATIYVDAVVVRGAESHGSFLSDWAIKPYVAIHACASTRAGSRADSLRYPATFYTEEGRAFGKRLWDETMEVLGPLGAADVVGDLKG